MGETLELTDVRRALWRGWWIPALLALMGTGAGTLAHLASDPVYRAKGTVLVGELDGTALRSTSLRASESLALFYADMARRQVVLEPVVTKLGLPMSWDTLREDVSAVAPDQNPRLITITVLDASATQAERIAEAVMTQLVSLSPYPVDGTEQQFVAQQTKQLKTTIEQTERQVQVLERRLRDASAPLVVAELRRQLAENQKLLNEWRRAYVDLTAIDPGTDAGGLQVVDEVTTSRSSSSAGMVGSAGYGGALGAVVGLVLSLLLSHRRTSRVVAQEGVIDLGESSADADADVLETAVNGWPVPREEPVGSAEPAPAPALR